MNLLNRFHSEKIKFYYNKLQNNPILDPEKSWDFIQEYFKFGGKEKAFHLDFAQELKVNGKHIHTISMYYIGCLLSKIIEKSLDQTLAALIPRFGVDFNYKFIYSWFLTCLYHDAASVIEDDNLITETVGIPNYYFHEMLKNNNIKYNVFDHNWTGKSYYTYTQNLIRNYFYYSLVYRRKKEHGIMGGLILFDRLKKNYEDKLMEYKKQNDEKEETVRENFELDGLSWRIQHLDHFAYIADAIISHNIWYSNDTIYKKFGLSKLKTSALNRISSEQSPLLYFLAIVDTIEPTKYFDQFQPTWIWENIDIFYNEQDRRVQIQILSDIPDYKKWFKKIESLNDWLNVKVEHLPETKQIFINTL